MESSRKLMVEEQIERRGIKDKKVLHAMLKVKRHEFVDNENAYSDYPLPIGEGQTISQPYIVALMTELLELKGKEKVLEIGTGSGYQAAILAEIAKKVITVERIGILSEKAKKALEKYKNIEFVKGDGTKAYKKEAPYDGIIVTAAADKVYPAYLDQLSDNGILVIPVESTWYQKLLQIRKTKDKIIEKHICDVRFVPLVEN